MKLVLATLLTLAAFVFANEKVGDFQHLDCDELKLKLFLASRIDERFCQPHKFAADQERHLKVVDPATMDSAYKLLFSGKEMVDQKVWETKICKRKSTITENTRLPRLCLVSTRSNDRKDSISVI
jgi:hypothetical protein